MFFTPTLMLVFKIEFKFDQSDPYGDKSIRIQFFVEKKKNQLKSIMKIKSLCTLENRYLSSYIEHNLIHYDYFPEKNRAMVILNDLDKVYLLTFSNQNLVSKQKITTRESLNRLTRNNTAYQYQEMNMIFLNRARVLHVMLNTKLGKFNLQNPNLKKFDLIKKVDLDHFDQSFRFDRQSELLFTTQWSTQRISVYDVAGMRCSKILSVKIGTESPNFALNCLVKPCFQVFYDQVKRISYYAMTFLCKIRSVKVSKVLAVKDQIVVLLEEINGEECRDVSEQKEMIGGKFVQFWADQRTEDFYLTDLQFDIDDGEEKEVVEGVGMEEVD